MRLFLTLLALAGAALPAFADVWTLYKGTTIVKPRVDYATLAACSAAVPKKAAGSFTCKTSVAVPLPVPVPDPVPPAATWTQIATEGGSFVFTGTRTVRYGRDIWIVKDITAGGECSNNFFGSDPQNGIVKTCQVSSVVPTQPTTPPVVIGNPPPPPPPIDHSMHGGIPVADASLWPKQTNVPKTIEFMTTGAPVPPLAPDDQEGAFRTMCFWTHMSFDDPIVYPGQPGAAHHHTFFGNAMVNAFTTSDNIRAAGNASSCRGGTANLTGYWMPSLIDTATGVPQPPMSIIVYYKNTVGTYITSGQSAMEGLPPGLRMITGTPGNANPQLEGTGGVAHWYCYQDTGNGIATNGGQTIPAACPVGAQLRMGIEFKPCWNGQLDSADHKSHMADLIDDAASPGWSPGHKFSCPTTHPHLIPQIKLLVDYRVPAGADISKWRLSSDTYDVSKPGGYSTHTDWFNGWDPAISRIWGANCITVRRDCGSATLGDGRSIGEWDGN